MSTPVDPTITQTVSIASVDELITQAKRLGLTWSLRPARVVEITSPFSTNDPRVVMDGDEETASITVVNLSSSLAVDMRVMVMSVPPLGNYIIGVISRADLARYEFGTNANHPTTIDTTERIMETFAQFRVLSKAAYRVELGGGLFTGTTTFVTFTLRKTNLAGQVIAQSGAYVGQGFIVTPLYWTTHFKNDTAQAITADIVLTAQVNASTAVWLGDSGRARYVSIKYAGPAVEYPSAVGMV